MSESAVFFIFLAGCVVGSFLATFFRPHCTVCDRAGKYWRTVAVVLRASRDGGDRIKVYSQQGGLEEDETDEAIEEAIDVLQRYKWRERE